MHGSHESLDRTENWETIGSIRLGVGIARTFGFGNADELGEELDFRPSAAPNPDSNPAPMRLDPYKQTSTDVPSSMSHALVLSATLQENPESDEEPLSELPVEVFKDKGGQVIAARLGYLTALIYDLGILGNPDPCNAIDVANGTWLETDTISLPSGHCVALNPHIRGRRLTFNVKPGDYVAEEFEFTDAELGYFQCPFGFRLRFDERVCDANR